MRLDADLAGRFAAVVLGHLRHEYPYKLDHVMGSDADVLPPRILHPIFYGSFDWHSCVHGWWTLLTLRRLHPDIESAGTIARLADDSFTEDKVATELAYLQRPLSRGFERPYGWAWLLQLHLEASRHHDRSWGDELEPLARAFADRFRAYLPLLTYPIRAGTHFNTAFALALALDWADCFDEPLGKLIRSRGRDWFLGDRDCQAWEPSGDDFLSSALVEALCMARVLDASEFDRWFADFLPRLSERHPQTLFLPAVVSDRTDGKIAHLDGLNLSRAWCWRSITARLDGDEAHLTRTTADEHLAAAMPHISGDYMGEHWLASFALLALLA